MNGFILAVQVLLIFLALKSLISLISFRSNKKWSRSDVARQAEAFSSYQLTEPQTMVLNQCYHIQLEDRHLLPIKGEISRRTLTRNGIPVESYYQYKGTRIHFCDDAADDVQQDDNAGLCVVYQGELYVVSLNTYCMVDDESLNMTVDSKQTTTVRTETLGERPMLAVENQMIHPFLMPSMLTCFWMILVPIFSALFILQFIQPAWCVGCLVVWFLVMYGGLWKRLKHPTYTPRTVVKMRGKLLAMQGQAVRGPLAKLRFTADNEDQPQEYAIEKAVLTDLKMNDLYRFEVDITSGQIVSIGNIYHLQEHAKNQPFLPKLHLSIMSGWLLGGLLLLMTLDQQEVNIAFQAYQHPRQAHFDNETQLYNAHLTKGEYLSLTGYRICHLESIFHFKYASDSIASIQSNEACKHFRFQSQPDHYLPSRHQILNPDPEKLAMLKNFAQIDWYPEITQTQYDNLKNSDILPGEHIESAHDTYRYTLSNVIAIAQFYDKYQHLLDDTQGTSKILIKMWQAMTHDTCQNDCWKRMIQQTTPQSADKFVVINRFDKSSINFHMQVEDIYREVRKAMIRHLNAYGGKVHISLIANTPQLSIATRQLLASLRKGHFFDEIQALEPQKIYNALIKEQRINDFSGYVAETEMKNNQLHIILDTNLTPTGIKRILYQLSVMFACFIFALLHLLLFIVIRIRRISLMDYINNLPSLKE